MDDQINELKGEHYEQIIPPAKANAAGHTWTQFGFLLKCVSCPFEHTFTPMALNGKPLLATHIYRGLDRNGQPIFEKIRVKK